jgi:hypothetical protein
MFRSRKRIVKGVVILTLICPAVKKIILLSQTRKKSFSKQRQSERPANGNRRTFKLSLNVVTARWKLLTCIYFVLGAGVAQSV